MKKCPFCAEEIQDEAIKCRYCSSFLSAAPGLGKIAGVGTKEACSGTNADDSVPSRLAVAKLSPAILESPRTPVSTVRKILYKGSPSWRAYFREYVVIVLTGLMLPSFLYWLGTKLKMSGVSHVLMLVIPFLVAVLAWFALQHYRRSMLFRVTATNMEVEHGFLGKQIDVLELWRCRDVRYRQSLLDRILSISHIEIYTTDVTTPHVCIMGMPASRELFSNIRDAIEIQRQSQNVLGMIQ